MLGRRTVEKVLTGHRRGDEKSLSVVKQAAGPEKEKGRTGATICSKPEGTWEGVRFHQWEEESGGGNVSQESKARMGKIPRVPISSQA